MPILQKKEGHRSAWLSIMVLGRAAKRKRTETPQIKSSAEPVVTVRASKAALKTPSSATGTPHRMPIKKFLPDYDVDDVDADADAGSVTSKLSEPIETSQEKEEALLAEGDCLSGDDLKKFLQKNFVDYLDDKVFEISSLNSLTE